MRKPVLIALLTTAPLLAQCDRDKAAEPAAPPPETAAVMAPQPAPTLDRTAFLGAAAAAAAAYAEGAAPGRDSLAGRTFSIVTAFGCSGPAPETTAGADGRARWSWIDDQSAIRLSASPGDWTGSALIATADAAPDWEAVEGFWITRPWIPAGGCPSVRRDPLLSGPPAASPETVGLAAVHTARSSRLTRRNGRPYTHVVRGESDAAATPSPGGYRLRLEGRLTAFPDGRAFRCRAAGPDQRPVCIAAAQLDRVAFETPDGVVLSEWRPG